MIFTIMTGIVWGHPALAFVHSYIGILIFVAFITVFWITVVKWLDKAYQKREPAPHVAEAQSV